MVYYQNCPNVKGDIFMVTMLICLAVLMIAFALLINKAEFNPRKVNLLLTDKIYAVPGIEYRTDGFNPLARYARRKRYRRT